MQANQRLAAAALLTLAGLTAACNHGDPVAMEHPMGDKVTLGPLTYNVIENTWYSQLGEGFNLRSAQQRFMSITLSITNGGGGDVAVPLLSLENSDGHSFVEVDNGDGLQNWLGLLRTVGPAQTMEGKILFDVPLASYRLRLTDGGGPGAEKYGWVTIPLRIDVDTGVQTPTPGDVGKE